MVKQVIVIRKDLKMRRGKEIAQGSHASMAFLTRRLEETNEDPWMWTHGIDLRPHEIEWMEKSFTKVCLQIDSEEALLKLHEEAQEAGLESHLIQDAGKTEFNGVPTYTCLAIGPDYEKKIDRITGHLKLY